jgi:deoxyribonuclease V
MRFGVAFAVLSAVTALAGQLLIGGMVAAHLRMPLGRSCLGASGLTEHRQQDQPAARRKPVGDPGLLCQQAEPQLADFLAKVPSVGRAPVVGLLGEQGRRESRPAETAVAETPQPGPDFGCDLHRVELGNASDAICASDGIGKTGDVMSPRFGAHRDRRETPRSPPSWNAWSVATSPGTGKALFIAVDVHYLDDSRARAAVVAAVDRRFAVIGCTNTAEVAVEAAYQPGEFYRRELPPLQAVIPRSGRLALIVVDGYVDLDAAGRPGLGAHVHAEYGVPVIGVAKTSFRTATHAAHVIRGRSGRPLYVTAAGIPMADAAHLVGEMAGSSRVPDGLRLADRLARGLELRPGGPPAHRS